MFNYGFLGHYWDNWFKQPSMYQVGAFFLSHKMVVRRNKLRRKYKR